MRIKFFVFFLFFFPGILCAISNPLCCKRSGYLSIGGGYWDVQRPKERMGQFQVEYKWGACWHGIQPLACVMATQKGSIYVCGGACFEIPFLHYFYCTPSFAPGIYFKNGGKELGYPLEFRSSIAFAGQFKNRHRAGVQFYHISNASLGFKNPGEESLVLFYSIPIW